MTPTPRERKTKSAAEALQSLMRLCARGERSTGDAMRLMRTWGVPEGERQAVVDRLVAQRFIDNGRYAELYVREKSRLSGWGARKIAMHLRTKGVEKEVIAEALATIDRDEQSDRLAEKLRRKMRTTKAQSDYEMRGKLLRYALGLGYDYDDASTALDKIMAER
ncbi:MAG: RecX family transcriptional regulator [Alistipes sp.]|nr:RecX family transcriptional regulator [Alistipes sp.]